MDARASKPDVPIAARPSRNGLHVSAACASMDRPLLCVWSQRIVHIMRTRIEIDDKLMSEALRATGAKTRREAVELALRTVVRLNNQSRIRRYRGRLPWEGDLDAMRTDA